MLARISAVQQRMGASRLTEASPVLRPTLSGPNSRHKRQQFLIDQRLDRAGVNRAPALGERLEMQRGGHERFARTGGRVEDDVFLLEQLEDGRFLRGIELKLPSLAYSRNRPSKTSLPGSPSRGIKS